MRTASVKRMQEELRTVAHYSGQMPEVTVDGHLDEQTQNAIRDFQKLCGLKATGEPDFDTCRRLDEVYALVRENAAPPLTLSPFGDCPVALAPGDASPTVAVTQAVLGALAAQYPNLPAPPTDGVYGDATAAAVRTLQAHCGMEETGRMDKRTWNAMARLYNAMRKRVC